MEFPMQFSGGAFRQGASYVGGGYDMRDHLIPRRLTIVMWDQAFLFRHMPGRSFEDYDRVLDETVERGYNTLRLDPMPQYIDLDCPAQVFEQAGRASPHLMPWGAAEDVKGPLGAWLIEFMEKVLDRNLHYTLSCWWSCGGIGAFKPRRTPVTHADAAEIWVEMLHAWKRRFGFEGLVYLDVANEVPYFLPGFGKRLEEATGASWASGAEFTPEIKAFVAQELNEAFALLRREFPELRYTASIHGDTRWLDVPVSFDCLDVHYYADADTRWTQRTRFPELGSQLFVSDEWHAEFSDRCLKTHQAVAPMLRARQRSKVAAFAGYAETMGCPHTTSESWSSWYYVDSPNLDWGWLLEWAEWSVEDARTFGMWGWTPHNYCQPQFENWRDVRWHRRLTDRFLSGA